jgi:hypothetical protein
MWYHEIDGFLYLNLSSRPERKQHMEKVLKQDLVLPLAKVQRIPAVPTVKGYDGCTQSHLKALNHAIVHQWTYMALFEDDFLLHVTPQTFHRRVDKAWQKLKGDFDVLYFAMTPITLEDTELEGFHRVKKALAMPAMVVHQRYFLPLKHIYEEALKNDKPHDMITQLHQPNSYWFGFYPPLARQKPGFSDIEKKDVDYAYLEVEGQMMPALQRSGLAANTERSCGTFVRKPFVLHTPWYTLTSTGENSNLSKPMGITATPVAMNRQDLSTFDLVKWHPQAVTIPLTSGGRHVDRSRFVGFPDTARWWFVKAHHSSKDVGVIPCRSIEDLESYVLSSPRVQRDGCRELFAVPWIPNIVSMARVFYHQGLPRWIRPEREGGAYPLLDTLPTLPRVAEPWTQRCAMDVAVLSDGTFKIIEFNPFDEDTDLYGVDYWEICGDNPSNLYPTSPRNNSP